MYDTASSGHDTTTLSRLAAARAYRLYCVAFSRAERESLSDDDTARAAREIDARRDAWGALGLI